MHIHTKSTISLLMLCAAGTALVACAPVGRSMQRVGTAIHQESAEIDRRVRDMFDAEGLDGGDLPQPVTPAYCYRTWGEVSCYSEPLPGEAHRFVGKQEPAPAFADYDYPYPEEKPELPMQEEILVTVEPPVPVIVEETHQPAPPPPPLPPSPPPPPQEMLDSGGVIYEVPEYAIRKRDDIPEYKKPRELIQMGEEY